MSFVCPECRDGHHDACVDTHSPDKLYRDCDCQHRPPRS